MLDHNSIVPSSFTIETPRGPRTIGPNEPCFVVAELSGNHNLQYDRAVDMITMAASTGVDAIKIQTYTPDTMTIDCDKDWFYVKGKDNPDIWKGQKLYDLYKTAYTPWEWHAPLKKITEDLGLVFFSTPFDPSAVDFLEKLEVPFYKISSYEATDYVLLKKVAATGKPIIMSVGFATEEEVAYSLQVLRDHGAKEIVLLHCVTAYSDDPQSSEMNLQTMIDIPKRFGVLAGFSDNNSGTTIPVIAATMGAVIIEKHFILDRTAGGPDARFSLEPSEWKQMIKSIRDVEICKGVVHYGCQSDKEEQNKFFRRSLFAVADVAAGEVFTEKNMRSIRPSTGLPSKHYDEVLGKKAAVSISRGTPLTWELIT